MRSPAFEQWYAEWLGVDLERVQEMWDEGAGTYADHSYHVEIAWAAWCAALGFVASRH